MDNLAKLRHTSKRKMIVMILSTLLPLIIVIVMSLCNFKISDKSVFNALPFLPIVLCVLFEAYIALKIIKYIKILRNDDFANSLIIKRNDERTKYINMKSYALVDKIFFYVIGLACIFTAFVDADVFYMCLAADLSFILIHIIVRIYYNKKY